MYPLFSFGSFNSASLFWDKSTVPDSGSFGTAKPLSTYRFTAFIGWGLSGVQVLAVSNDICMNVHIQVLCFPFNCRERRGCLVGTHLIFWEMAKLFSKEAVPFCNPSSGVPGIHSLRILPQTWWGLGPQLLAFLEHVLTSPCISLNICEVECCFLCYLYKIFCIFFGKITVQVLPIFHCVISYSIQLKQCFMYSRYRSDIVRYLFYKNLLPVCDLSSYFYKCFWKAKGFFKIILLIYFWLCRVLVAARVFL